MRCAASQIVENILAGMWTASVVLEAYIARAAQAQQAMNCLTEGTYRLCLSHLNLVCNDNSGLLLRRIVFFEEAKQDARKLDDEFAATGRLKGPLHGVPISVK